MNLKSILPDEFVTGSFIIEFKNVLPISLIRIDDDLGFKELNFTKEFF